MTTPSSIPQSNDPAIPATENPGSLSSPTPVAVGRSGPAYGDPVDGLVRAAVADRPLEEVAQLITLLEQSPLYARATVDALRAVGVNRSVDDVTRLVVLLTRPPRDVASADEAIHAAAETRPVEDVTRLMALLQQAPLEPHCGQEAVRAAATGRSVEELVELIGRLAEERKGAPPSQTTHAPADDVDDVDGVDDAGLHRDPAARPGLARRRTARPPAWPARLTAVALLLCAVAHVPVHQDGVSLRRYGLVLGLAGLCLLLGLLVAVRPAAPVLAAAVLVPAALAAAQLYASRFDSGRLSAALDLTLAPAWIAGLAAVCAALAALAALAVRPASHAPGRSAADRLPAK
ncbi:hypothetical protein ACFWWC_17615 [Streptomyces sp. NPDC058642]|uniref:hypothetical protein n=1 Tax=Streptomyces sp. NPDC058642 TaxID=3346572 RepID=UPI00365B4DE6